MSSVPNELRDEIPTFDGAGAPETGRFGGLAASRGARSVRDLALVVALGVAVMLLVQAVLALSDTPEYVFPRPFAVLDSLVGDFGSVYLPHLIVTLEELLLGLAIGSTIGLVLAALVTQRPGVEKLIAPYIIVLVTTPMLALVPFLRLKLGFGISPIVIAVALASGPMVLINASTGFARTDLGKIALARSYGASTFQIFRTIRFPLALPMIIVGYMVGSIFGLLTAVGGEMVAASERGGLGQRLVYYSSLVEMDRFGAVMLIVSALGLTIYGVFSWITKRWASWEA